MNTGAGEITLDIEQRLFVRVIDRDDGGAGAEWAIVNGQRGHVIGAMFVNRNAVGANRQTGARVKMPAVRGAKEVVLLGNAPDAGRALRVHLVPDSGPGNDDETKVVLPGRSRQRQQVIRPIEMKRGLVVQFSHGGNELRLQAVDVLSGRICRSALVDPAADEEIGAGGADCGRVAGRDGVRAQPDLEPDNSRRVGRRNDAGLAVLAGSEHQEEPAGSDCSVAKSPLER